MNEAKTLAERNLIDDHFEIYNARRTKPTEAQKALEPYLNTISKEFDEKLFEYVSETQKEAYHAGFATAMQLAADCYSKCKKIVPYNP
ncbi:MAG: hypothetical protein LUF35_08400 [Lachnospiraceae bacterium]|nr:hypothetical protein [Lachnospiraceae bacterium]